MSNTLIQSLRAERDMAMKDAHDAKQALHRARESEAALLAACKWAHQHCALIYGSKGDAMVESLAAAIAKAEGR